MGSRRRSREFALQCLYGIEISHEDPERALAEFWAEHPADEEVRRYASGLVKGACAARGEIDRLIAGCAKNWTLERMAAVDRNILRLAVYEMRSGGEPPPAVIINEAVDIAKKYSTPDSGAFVNGILDRIHKDALRDGNP
ncbi:MAG: transcription antitermination factor NusB [Candidatus Aureabacteria bacterium]|nr:transcription antitermination factor NusB [Candidatus Auribacterota bacterium]NLW93850.1 transcription antitermination factor NusB [Chlamydiota bacterium]HOE27711.1 transcription antitermination factor NusB [bacterium]